MQDKKKTKHIKVRDLKPKKDAKGGAVANTKNVTGMFGNQTHNQTHNQTRNQG